MRRISILPARRATSRHAVQALYDRAAKGWQQGMDRIGYAQAYVDLASKAVAHSPVESGEHILDAGAGTGALSAALCRFAREPALFDLLDLSSAMLDQADTAIPFETRKITGGIGDIDLPKGHYDRLLCGHAIEHCDNPQAAIAWLHDRLKPGGQAVFAISKPHWCTALIRWKYGSAAFRRSEVNTMLEAAGFTGIQQCPHAKGPPSRISCGYIATRAS